MAQHVLDTLWDLIPTEERSWLTVLIPGDTRKARLLSWYALSSLLFHEEDKGHPRNPISYPVGDFDPKAMCFIRSGRGGRPQVAYGDGGKVGPADDIVGYHEFLSRMGLGYNDN